MKKIALIILLFGYINSNAQLTSLVARGDTLFNFDPSTGVWTQLTKSVPAQAGQSGKVLSTNGTTYTWYDIATALSVFTNDYRAANFIAGTNYLAPNGNGSSLTGLTASQVNLGNVTNESKATMFTSPTFTGTVSGVTSSMVGLGNVDNTSDLNKPISTAEQTALNLKANLSSPTLVTPVIGVATGTSLSVTGAISSTGTAGIGYATGAGGTVTQNANKSTGVTLNKISGTITMNNAALAAGAEAKFTVTNSTVAATDVPVVAIKSGGTSGSYLIAVSSVASGSFDIVVSNASTGSLSEAIVISFVIIKGVAN